MPNTNIGSATVGDLATYYPSVQVPTKSTDATTGDDTRWTNTEWSKWLGFYKTIPEVKIAIDTRAIWTIGKGYTAPSYAKVILDHISGWGTDTFNSILKNMIITRRIGGDSYAEIIRHENGKLINLKPLDPGTMTIIVNAKGILQGYEQSNVTGGITKFKPNEIFHLLNKRVADEIHGVSDIEAIQHIVDASNESFVINTQIIKNFSKPKMMVEIDSDDVDKIDGFVKSFDDATSKGDNLFYPKGTVNPQVLAVPSNATLNVLPWREHLRTYFFQVVGIPQIILGSSGEFTESTAKIAYLAFQQSVEDEQLDIEEQIWNQLFLKVELSFPASIQNDLITDDKKDGSQGGTNTQPNDTATGGVENA